MRILLGYASVFSAFWFDSGYMLRQFTEAWEFHAFSA